MIRSFLLLALLLNLAPEAGLAQAPSTPIRLVVDTLHGTPAPDPYRWLQNLESAEVQAWFRAQGEYARATLDGLNGRDSLLARKREIAVNAPPEVSLPREAGDRWFYTMRRPGESAARGYVRDLQAREERLLVDPAVDGGAGTAAGRLTTFLPSPDGRLVLYGITTGGSEQVALRVRDVESGRDMDGPIDRNLWQAWWDPSGRAFYYWRIPDEPATGGFPDIRTYRHELGADPTSDVAVLSGPMVGEGNLLNRIEFDPQGSIALGRVRADRYSSYYVAPAASVASGTPTWRPLFTMADSVVVVIPHDSSLYVLTEKGTPRIVRTDLDAPDLATAQSVLVSGTVMLQDMSAALDALYVQVFSEGVNRIIRIRWGESPVDVELPPGTSVAGADLGSQVLTDPLRSGAVLMLSSWTAATRPFRYDAVTDRLEPLPLSRPGPWDRLDGYVAETVFAPGHDGVRVPLTIVRPERFARDGSLPMWLVGYGAYGETDAPAYDPDSLPWYESGGAAATCHVRGGGYYGPAWHEAGRLSRKPNTWLDFIACAEYLIREGYTRPQRLVVLGGSAGGITVGRAITERPDLFAAAIISNGVLDAIGNESSMVGSANIPEFGSAETADGFRGLLAMSAYHHVEPATAYPAVMLMIGLDDIRVPPWESAKMAAALQAATSSGRPVLLRVNEVGGHDSGAAPADLVRELTTDVATFARAAMGLSAYRRTTGGG